MINLINNRQYLLFITLPFITLPFISLLFITLFSCTWLALVQAEVVIRRDPFANLAVNDCRRLLITQENDLKKWQLLGIIGQKEHWVGWVLTEQGEWLVLKANLALLNKGWQVLTISSTSVELISRSAQDHGCQTSSRLYLIEDTMRKEAH